VSWALLTPDEVEDYWSLGVALEAVYVPDDQLTTAIAERRVETAHSWSSMGTAETYWERVGVGADLASLRSSAVAWPPGHVVDERGHDYDDRDVYGVLWQAFFSEQQRTAIAHVPPTELPRVRAECARVLGALEEAWVSEHERVERTPYIALLYAAGPIDEVALDEWLAFRTNKDEAHLVAGVRARWLTASVHDLVDAVMESAGRFGLYSLGSRKGPMSREEVRHALVRLMVGLARGRGWRGVEIESHESAFEFEPALITRVQAPREGKAPIEECAKCKATPSPPRGKLADVSETLAFCTKCRTFYAIENGVAVRLPLLQGGVRLAKAKNPAFDKWVNRRWKQVGDEMAALAALVSDPTAPRDHIWEYARASVLDGFSYHQLIERALVRNPDPIVRVETLHAIATAAEAGDTSALGFLRRYPPDRVLRGLRGNEQVYAVLQRLRDRR